jgi:hypothetical protein
MNPFKNRQEHNSEEALQQSLFKEYYPMVLSIVDELQPLLQLNVDQREVLAMASMMLGQLTQRGERGGRRELRKAIEQYIVETFALEKDRKMLLDDGSGSDPDGCLDGWHGRVGNLPAIERKS